MEIKFEKLDSYDIGEFEYVKIITTAPHLQKVIYNRNPNCEARIRNIDKDHYEVIKTGKIKERKHTKKRSDSVPSLRKTRRDIIDIINTNVVELDKCKFITLTYKGEMRDTKVFNDDINLFVKNFNYRYKTNKNIKVCVPQLRGTYHAHIIFIFDTIAPYIPYQEISNLWGKGSIDVSKIDKNVDDLGVYLSSQFCDIPMEDMDKYNIPYEIKDVKIVDEIDGKKLDKPRYFVKNGIANLIPPGFRILRPSRGLKKVSNIERKKYHEYKKSVGYIAPTFKSVLRLTLEDKKQSWSNIIVKEFYNLKRLSLTRGPSEKDYEVLRYLKNQEKEEQERLRLYEESQRTNPDSFDF